MITSKKDYKEYYFQDLKQSDLLGKKWYERITERRFKFYKALRYTEYYYNCKNKFFHKIPKKANYDEI